MARKPRPLLSPAGGTPAEIPDRVTRGIDRVLAIQRPVVLAHLRSIRQRHPHASPQQLITILERRYVAAVTSGGAAVGATAVIPGIGTGITLALSGVETAGFLEATALFAQSLSEVHGLPVADPDRARALVMTMMLGREGSDLVRQLAGQATGAGLPRARYWGELITNSIPSVVMGPLTDKLKRVFVRHFAVRTGAGAIGRAMPFGVGAVIGGAGNNIMARRVLKSSRLGFGVAPDAFAPALDPRVRVIDESGRTRWGAAADQAGRIAASTAGNVRDAGSSALRALPGWKRSKPGPAGDQDRDSGDA